MDQVKGIFHHILKHSTEQVVEHLATALFFLGGEKNESALKFQNTGRSPFP